METDIKNAFIESGRSLASILLFVGLPSLFIAKEFKEEMNHVKKAVIWYYDIPKDGKIDGKISSLEKYKMVKDLERGLDFKSYELIQNDFEFLYDKMGERSKKNYWESLK